MVGGRLRLGTGPWHFWAGCEATIGGRIQIIRKANFIYFMSVALAGK
jgi:hypothetical protein